MSEHDEDCYASGEASMPEMPLDDRGHAERGMRASYQREVMFNHPPPRCSECNDARAYVDDTDNFRECEACK